MEQSIKAIYMAFATLTFVTAITVLMTMQMAFDGVYEKIMEVVNGGFIW